MELGNLHFSSLGTAYMMWPESISKLCNHLKPALKIIFKGKTRTLVCVQYSVSDYYCSNSKPTLYSRKAHLKLTTRSKAKYAYTNVSESALVLSDISHSSYFFIPVFPSLTPLSPSRLLSTCCTLLQHLCGPDGKASRGKNQREN